MSEENRNEQETFRSGPGLDPILQRELDEALGGMSIEDVLAQDEAREKAEAPAPDGLEQGRIISVDSDGVLVELSGHRQGIVPVQQFQDIGIQIGDTVEVLVEGYDANEDLLMLSREGAAKVAAWDTLHVGQVVEGRATGLVKGGLELDINKIRGFMPLSQIDLSRVDDASLFLNQTMRCKVIELNRADENLIVSRRAMMEEEAAKNREKLWETITEGQVVTGIVRNIMPYGAFVDIGGADGLLHVSDCSWSRVEHPKEVVSVGQEVTVKILKLDTENRKISLGLKQTQPSPWQNAESKWPVESTVEGAVTRLADFGAFVELEEGVEGLIPIGELAYGRRLRHPQEVVKVGDRVRVRVIGVEPKRKRISLSLKRMGDDPWLGAAARWPAESVVDGTVVRIVDFGVFVKVADGVEGLVHISEISPQRIRHPADAVKEGQEVKVKVLSVDEDARKISLSIRKAVEPPPAEIPDKRTFDAPTRPAADRERKRKKPLKGGLDW